MTALVGRAEAYTLISELLLTRAKQLLSSATFHDASDDVYCLSDKRKRDATMILLLSLACRIKRKPSQAQEDKPPLKRYYVKNLLGRNPLDSVWWKDYVLDEQCLYQSSSGYRSTVFRNKFRMRRDTFLWFVALAKDQNWFPNVGKRDALGVPGAPLELLIMGSLAYLGNTISFTNLPDVTNVSSQRHRVFFHEFIDVGKSKMYPLWVNPPSTPTEIAQAMKGYTDAGLPGAICSTDGTRIRQWMCPNNLKQRSTGKEGYPCRAFQISVSYKTEILHSTPGWDGSTNDVTITHYDPFLLALQEKTKYADVEWEMVDSDGNVTRQTGCWSLVDGGYPSWEALICPIGNTSDEDGLRWSHWMESLRKDVERTFGIMKQRFRILKFGITLQSVEAVDKAWFTCCALHNILLHSDEKPDDFQHSVRVGSNSVIGARLSEPVQSTTNSTTYVRKSTAYINYRKRFVDHFNYQWENGEVRWPSKKGRIEEINGSSIVEPFQDADEFT
jgi:hypothetical protein